jgi:AcrR family transcriptional regulator
MQSTLENISSVAANAFLSAVFLVGTGGFAVPRIIAYVPSGTLQVRMPRGDDSKIDADRMLDAQEKLAGIRRYLSLTVSDLARVLRVGRPTVYSWLRDEASLRAEHAHRLEAIYRMAREWRAMSTSPVGSFLNQPAASGDALLTLLSARVLDSPAIQSAFAQIRAASARTSRRPSVMEVAKQRGFKLAVTHRPTNWRSDEDFDI